MKQTEEISELGLALLKFSEEVEPIVKESKNPFFKTKYAKLEFIQKAIKPHLVKNGLIVIQAPAGENGLTTRILHAKSSQWVEESFIMTPSKNDPQGIGSSLTYQKRYAQCAFLNLIVEGEDDDGNQSAGNTGKKPQLKQGTPEWKKVIAFLAKGKSIEEAKKSFTILAKDEENLMKEVKALNT